MKRVNKIRVRAISDASADQPAVTPDTLLEFSDLSHSFLQYYCIHGEEVDWYGRLDNLGIRISTPLTLMCPPELTEILGIHNFDTVSISLAAIPPLKEVSLRFIKPLDLQSDEHLEFTAGLKATKDDTFIYRGHVVSVVNSRPAIGFITPNTHIDEDIIEPETKMKQLPPETTS